MIIHMAKDSNKEWSLNIKNSQQPEQKKMAIH
jgi:hypothetical protein